MPALLDRVAQSLVRSLASRCSSLSSGLRLSSVTGPNGSASDLKVIYVWAASYRDIRMGRQATERAKGLLEGLRESYASSDPRATTACADSKHLSLTSVRAKSEFWSTDTFKLPRSVVEYLGVDTTSMVDKKALAQTSLTNCTQLIPLEGEESKFGTEPSKALLVFSSGHHTTQKESNQVLMALMERDPESDMRGFDPDAKKQIWTVDRSVAPVILHFDAKKHGVNYGLPWKVAMSVTDTISPFKTHSDDLQTTFDSTPPVELFKSLMEAEEVTQARG